MFGSFGFFAFRGLQKNIKSEMKRTESYESVAIQLGLTFYPDGDDSLPEKLSNFHLFSQGHTKMTTNLLSGKIGDIEVTIFGYMYSTGDREHSTMYSTGHREHSTTYIQSVIFMRSPSLNLPHFALRPEHIFHKLGSVLGYQDIDFASHPKFSKNFLLRGRDEEAVRGIFTDDILSFFESRPGVSAEGGGDQLIFYRADKRIEPEAIVSFMEDGSNMFKLLKL